MRIHFERDLERLRKEILAVGSLVEEATDKAIRALLERREDLAREVLRSDDSIDAREVAVEEECLKCLALHQPVAADLRFVVVILKVNNDLERMGDLAVNIAERAIYLATHPPLDAKLDFPAMARRVLTMVRESLDALLRQDAPLARQVLQSDDEVDRMNRQMFKVTQKRMVEDPSTIKRAVHALSASRHLERIADLATNIAEDVLFMVTGEVVRHQAEEFSTEEET